MASWKVRFLLGRRELVEQLVGFLSENLNEAYTYGSRAGEVEIGSLRDKTDAWKVGMWVHHQSGIKPRFLIEAKDGEGRVVYVSTCMACRDQKIEKPHHLHSKE